MNKRTLFSIATSTLITALAVVGITYAATPGSAETSLVGKGTVEVDSIKVGTTGSGGVTFFNGTIINAGDQTPVTFGDDVRVDGRIWRGQKQGPGLGDNKPYIINDDTQIAGSLEVGGTDIFAAIDAKANTGDVTANTSNIAASTTNITSNDVDIASNKSDINANTTATTNNAGDISSNDTDIATNTGNVISNASGVSDNAVEIAVNSSAISSKANDSEVVKKTTPTWDVQTGYIQIPGSAFIPEDVDLNGGALTSSYSTFGLVNDSGAARDYFAPVQLPHGVTVTDVSMMYLDNDVSFDFSLFFSSVPFSADTYANIFTSTVVHASMTSSGSSADYAIATNSSITSPVVDNNSRYYVLFAALTSTTGAHTLASVKITYTYTTPH